MGSNLAKAPLLAVVYASLYNFILALFPFSEGYRTAYAALITKNSYYLMLGVYGLWVAVILALLFAHGKGQKMSLLLPVAVPVLAFVCVLPQLEQAMFGVGMPVLTNRDAWLQVAAWVISTVLLLVLCLLLYQNDDSGAKQPQLAAAPKYKIKTMPLVIKCLAAPFICSIFYFVTWYLLGWRFDAVRMYYLKAAEAPADKGFVLEMVDLLVRNPAQVPYSMLLGILVMVLGIPLLMQLPGKRGIFIGIQTMLSLCCGIFWMVPGVSHTQQLGSAQLVRYSVLFLVYGALTGILLHTSLQKQEPQSQPAVQPAARPGQARAPQPATPRRSG